MTKFIESFATQQLLPPWKSEDSTCWCFAVPLSEAFVKQHLEQYFNAQYPPKDSPYHYDPLPTPQYGLVVVCVQPRICSEPNGDYCLSHNEVYLAIPVHRHQEGLEAPRVVWVQPFVFGDNATVLFSTREIVGLDMAFANIGYTAAAADQLSVDVEINGMKSFGPSAPAELIPCMHIGTGAVSKKTLGDFAKANPDLGAFLDVAAYSGFFLVPAPLEAAAKPAPAQALAPRPCLLDTLKQFRDVYSMEAAVYRAIVGCQSTHSQLGPSIYFEPDQVELNFTWSASMSEILGKVFGLKQPAGTDPIRVPVELAFSFTSTVEFSVIDTLHTYGG